jgi:hypothetical protein
MYLPVLGEAIRLTDLAAVAVAITAITPLHEHRVHQGTHQRQRQRRHHAAIDHTLLDLHHAPLLARLMHGGILQALGNTLASRRTASATPLPPQLILLTIRLQDGLGIGRIFVAGHQVHQPALGATVEVLHQQQQVMEDGKDLRFGQAGIEQRGAFAFGEALLAGAAVEEASLLRSIVSADGQVAVSAFAEVGAVGVEATENAEVVHGGSVPSKGEGVAASLPLL